MWSHAHVEGHFISSFLYFYLLHITHALRFESLWSSRASSNMVFHFLWFICMISFVRLMDFLQITVFRTAHHSLKRIVHPKMKSQFLFCVKISAFWNNMNVTVFIFRRTFRFRFDGKNLRTSVMWVTRQICLCETEEVLRHTDNSDVPELRE